MQLCFFEGWIVWHAGTPVALSQTTLTVMLVVLGMALIGFGFGRIAKIRENYQLHRWILTSVIVLSIVTIFFVMLPAAFRFYIDPDVEVFSALSIVTLIHSALGFPAISIGLVYALGDLPKNVKMWMQRAAFFWIIALASGTFLFLLMMELL